MPQIGLTTFLKLFSKTTPQKMKEYGKYLTPGGYDFYWTLKDSATALTVGGKQFSECEKLILSMKRQSERDNNIAGLKSLSKWLDKQQNATFFEAPKAVCKSPKGHLLIKIEPEFGIKNVSERRLVTVWNAKSPDMSQTISGVGIYLMQQFLHEGEFADCKSAILDLRKNSLFVADVVPANVAMMVASEFAWVDEFFEQAKQATKTEVPIAAHAG
jgi:hypothetical protein